MTHSQEDTKEHSSEASDDSLVALPVRSAGVKLLLKGITVFGTVILMGSAGVILTLQS